MHSKAILGIVFFSILLGIFCYGMYDFLTFREAQRACYAAIDKEDPFIEIEFDDMVTPEQFEFLKGELGRVSGVREITTVTADEELTRAVDFAKERNLFTDAELREFQADPLPLPARMSVAYRPPATSEVIISRTELLVRQEGILIRNIGSHDHARSLRWAENIPFDWFLFRPAADSRGQPTTRNAMVKGLLQDCTQR